LLQANPVGELCALSKCAGHTVDGQVLLVPPSDCGDNLQGVIHQTSALPQTSETQGRLVSFLSLINYSTG